jgi:hypothetical protein
MAARQGLSLPGCYNIEYPDDGRMRRPKHVSANKWETKYILLAHLLVFPLTPYHNARYVYRTYKTYLTVFPNALALQCLLMNYKLLLHGSIPALNRGVETRTTKDITQRLRAENRIRISRHEVPAHHDARGWKANLSNKAINTNTQAAMTTGSSTPLYFAVGFFRSPVLFKLCN